MDALNIEKMAEFQHSHTIAKIQQGLYEGVANPKVDYLGNKMQITLNYSS